MKLAEEIYRHSLNLSPEAARAALDFIEFLETRRVVPLRLQPGASPTEAFLERHVGALGDDFPDDVDDGDLGQDLARQPLE